MERSPRGPVATAAALLLATGLVSCGARTPAPEAGPTSPAPTASAARFAPDAYAENVMWAARNLLGWTCSLTEPTSYKKRNPRWELVKVLADYGELGPPNAAGRYRLTLDGGLALNGRTLPLPAGTSWSTTFTNDGTEVRLTVRPSGDGTEWRTLAPQDGTANAADVARYALRLADYDLLNQVGYRCSTGGGITSGELTRRSRNAAPALEVLRPDGTRIPLISVGGF